MDEQRALRHCYETRCHGANTALAAVPSCSAPHIRCGRQDHALDLNWPDASWVIEELNKMGLQMRRTVKGEAWHWEIANEKLLRSVAIKAQRSLGRRKALADLRARYARVRAAILKRQKAGKSSPDQRKLLGRLRDQIARLR